MRFSDVTTPSPTGSNAISDTPRGVLGDAHTPWRTPARPYSQPIGASNSVVSPGNSPHANDIREEAAAMDDVTNRPLLARSQDQCFVPSPKREVSSKSWPL